MKRHPVTVSGYRYRGSDARKQAKAAEYDRVASKVETYLRDAMEKLPKEHCVQMFISFTVAYAIGEQPELVREIISGIDGGSNGVTLWKGDYDLALADLRSS